MNSLTPIVDLHCDLPAFLAEVAGAHPDADQEIGCSLPQLRAGGVCLQVMAIYGLDPRNLASAPDQVDCLHHLIRDRADAVTQVTSATELEAAFDIRNIRKTGKIGVIAALESLSTVCTDDEPLARGFDRFERIVDLLGPLAYVSLTHAKENRFGGGNASRAGLKDDGREFLDLLAQKGIPVDLSHTSDPLAEGILDHIDRGGLQLPVIASHSNFRAVWDCPRNLPDDLAREIIKRGGIIGLNFLRAFLHDEDPTALGRHLRHALDLGGKDAICFGADFFCPGQHPDRSREPFYFPEFSGAARYPAILEELAEDFAEDDLTGLAHRNGVRFYRRLWGGA